MASLKNWLDYDVDALVAADKNYLWHHMKPHKLFEDQEQMIIVEGQGLIVKDIRGREYLDASSGGVWSVVVGYGRDSIADAVCAQLKKMPYFAGVVGNVPAIQFAQKLIELLPRLGKVYYSNSGSEANEKAYKIVRQASCINPTFKGKYKILFRDRDYHGTTLGALSSTGQEERKQDFGPLCEGFAMFPHALCYRCAFDHIYPECNIECARAVEEIILRQGPESVGAIIVEPITAGGGIIVPVPEYYPMLEAICKKYGVLMIMDEVVCGFGRTGRFWGHDHYDVNPDMVTLAKGLTSSYEALSATVVKESVYELFLNDPADPADRLNYFRDISTYGGCTSGMTAALESTRIIEQEDLVANSQAMGAYLIDRLMALLDFPIVGDVRGRGLFCGIEFVQDKKTKTPISEKTMAQIVARVNAEGVLVGRTNTSLPGNNTIMNLAPALIVTREQIDQIVAAIKTAIEKID
jgi:taurine-pyruvate aminotransferase